METRHIQGHSLLPALNTLGKADMARPTFRFGSPEVLNTATASTEEMSTSNDHLDPAQAATITLFHIVYKVYLETPRGSSIRFCSSQEARTLLTMQHLSLPVQEHQHTIISNSRHGNQGLLESDLSFYAHRLIFCCICSLPWLNYSKQSFGVFHSQNELKSRQKNLLKPPSIPKL